MLTLDKYQLLEEVGKGGMGVVYKAQDNKLGRIVALKELVLSHGLSDSDKENIISRFKREARTAAGLCHPNIVTVFDFGEDNNRHFIAMEFLKGKNLKDYIDEGIKFDWKELTDIFIQTGEGLSHAHDMNIIHRDIKPGNIQILPHNIIKITDFGLARAQDATSSLTQDGAIFGTLGYMSPEQIVNAKGVDNRADIFSFGASMYEAITGKIPFEGDNIAATIYRIMALDPYPMKDFRPDIPDKLEKIILKTLEKDPEKRYRKVSEIIDELKDFNDSSKSNVIIIANPKIVENNLKETPEENIITVNNSNSEKITKGQKLVVSDYFTNESMIIGLNSVNNEVYPELSVMLLNKDNKITNEEDFVFYNNLSSPCSSIRIDSSENNLYKSLIEVDLTKVPDDIQRIKFLLSLDQPEKNLSDMHGITVNLIGENTNLLYKADDFSEELTSIILEIYKYKDKWKIHAAGDGFKKNLSEILHDYLDEKIQIS